MKIYLVVVPPLLIAALVWASQPKPGQLDETTCDPSGIRAGLSRYVYGADFWRAQLPGIKKRREFAENYEQISARNQAMLDQSLEEVLQIANANMASMYEKYPNLAPSPAEGEATALRKRADQIEAEANRQFEIQAFLRLVPSLKSCEDFVASQAYKH